MANRPNYYKVHTDGHEVALEPIYEELVPVVHGRWIISSDGYYPYCFACKEEPRYGEMTNYCPNCGAKMDGSE